MNRPTTALLYAISCYDDSSATSIPMIKLLVRLNADVRIEGWSFLFRDRSVSNLFEILNEVMFGSLKCFRVAMSSLFLVI